jgi:hypothetical protein
LLGSRIRASPGKIAYGLKVVLCAAFALPILWATLPNPLRVEGTTRAYQEIIWFSSQYISPLFYWLALVGVIWLLWRLKSDASYFLVLALLGLAGVFFSSYTSAAVYPVSLRRLTTDVLPLMALLGGVALGAPLLSLRWRPLQWTVGALAVVWVFVLSWPVVTQRESRGSLAFVEDFHREAPVNAVLMFERQDDDSWVGWLAAPLYSLFGDWAILLDTDTPDSAMLAKATEEYEGAGRSVFLVSQHNPLPAPMVPQGYHATLVQETHWRSTLIGQTRKPYPPPYWEFDFPVYVFALRRGAGS